MKQRRSNRSVTVRLTLAAVILLAVLALAIVIAHRAHAPVPEPTPEPEQTDAAETATPEPTPTPEPTETPAPSAQPNPDALAVLNGMSTREKICQLLVVQPEYLTTSQAAVTSVSDGLARSLQEYPVGGILLTLPNMTGPTQLQTLTADLQSASGIPLILCLDEEGGDISRLMVKVGTTKLDNMYTYRNQGPSVARQNGATLGRDLARFGFNTDLAPVADVWSNPKNEVIGERAYSDNYEQAAELVGAAVLGFHDSGTICCLKHFPGHGSTRTDSHQEAAYVDRTLGELRKGELLPFISGISAGADMVMVGHLTVPSIDTVPATYSKRIVTGLLREELGFDGVVITDGMEMNAAGKASDGEKALRALNAGCDLILGIVDIPGTVQALEQAVADGTLTMEELDAHVLRVLEMKAQYGLLP